jgi:transcriptional regulator GlxA family with amidase domain
LAATHPELEVRRGARWVEAGRVVTSAGVSAGIDMSLRLIARILGEEASEAVARETEYAPAAASGVPR